MVHLKNYHMVPGSYIRRNKFKGYSKGRIVKKGRDLYPREVCLVLESRGWSQASDSSLEESA